MAKFGFTKEKSGNSLKLTSRRDQISVSEFLIILCWLLGLSFIIDFNLTKEINPYFYFVNTLGIISLLLTLLVIINERVAIYELVLSGNNLTISKKGLLKSRTNHFKKKSITRIYLKRIGFPRFFEEVPLYTILRSTFSFFTLKIPALDLKDNETKILFCNNISLKNRKWIVETLNYYLDN